MKRARLAVSFLAAGALWGCGDSSGPGSGVTTAKVTDPTGDAFGANPVQWDLTAMTITRDTGGVTILLDFSSTVIPPASGDTTAMIGFVDLDVDQDSTTGFSTLVDTFRPGSGSTGMGSDYLLELTSATGVVLDTLGGATGQVAVTYSGTRVTVRIPRSRIGNDDAFLNAAAIVGTNAEPTDIIPENGHLKVGGTGMVAPYRPHISVLRTGPAAQRVWGSRR
jgi:hypothetical protein